jgi:hypothetical protein
MPGTRVNRATKRTIGWVSVAVMGMGILATGCSSSTSAAPTKASYATQANAICKEFNGKLNAIGSSSGQSLSQVQALLAEAVPLAERGQAKLEALPKPSDESAALNKVYAAQQTQVNQLKALANAVNAGDATKIQSISATLNALGGPLNSQFDALGLTACGSGSSGN